VAAFQAQQRQRLFQQGIAPSARSAALLVGEPREHLDRLRLLSALLERVHAPAIDLLLQGRRRMQRIHEPRDLLGNVVAQALHRQLDRAREQHGRPAEQEPHGEGSRAHPRAEEDTAHRQRRDDQARHRQPVERDRPAAQRPHRERGGGDDRQEKQGGVEIHLGWEAPQT
jgi:hypothetical protein